MNAVNRHHKAPLTRRRFLHLAGGSAAAAALMQAATRPAQAVTWRLHDDTNQVGLSRLYSGSENYAGCDTGESAVCKGPGRMSCYWGGLYVNSVTYHRLRTGPVPLSCNDSFPGISNLEYVRWASHYSASAWAPEYRFVGKVFVYGIKSRPQPYLGLVLHPVHRDNCNNYYVRLWERDNPSRVVWGKEVNDAESWIISETLPSPPQTGVWYDYRIDVLPGSRLRFYWDNQLIFDHTDPQGTYSQGPVGMRLDYFNAILDETRVYQP